MPDPDALRHSPEAAASPVEWIGDERRELEHGIGLCLSGGGYRAMLFHVGALWRLNDLGYLRKLSRISSVSGGSITAGVLGLNWSRLAFDAASVARELPSALVEPMRRLAGRTIDVRAVLDIRRRGSIADRVAERYDKHLFGGTTLQDLPSDPPRFVINATNVQSGALWRFMKPYMRDYRVGEVRNPTVSLAVAVAASSAFPPFLSPLRLELKASSFTPNSGADLQRPPYTTDVILTDGGVYDNLGLETVWKRYDTVLVSNGGGQMAPEERPKKDWLHQTRRVLDLIDNQVRSLRQRQVVGSFEQGVRKGAYWGIRTDIAEYGTPGALPCPRERTMELANVPTRLKGLDGKLQERLINWGYAVCDAAVRRYLDPALPAPTGFPYRRGV